MSEEKPAVYLCSTWEPFRWRENILPFFPEPQALRQQTERVFLVRILLKRGGERLSGSLYRQTKINRDSLEHTRDRNQSVSSMTESDYVHVSIPLISSDDVLARPAKLTESK